ncbi:6-phospho-beta-glucosidase [Anaeroselena agilis]|uniref:6-phospho-beta-glucosidase n=1 Tax=Anaeroselena agilis TaxID=3063788 RepID=A0ABU3NY48_9FIRM|nr:6-phospho-beta-glucosidase [Selenomonadales bacterium 4137-cl]
MNGLKLAVIGGGSSYTPELVDGVLRRAGELPVAELWLADIPSGEEKLAVVAALARRMAARAGSAIEVHTTLDRRQALAGAHYVITQLRVGGLAARVSDERIPLKYDVLGQETVGPGGFANALRTVPVVLDICRDIEALCPDAWLINFANPAGLVTEAVLGHSAVKCIGLCNVPINMVMTAAKLLDAVPADVAIDFAGLNHLVWGLAVRLRGEDVTGVILAKLADGAALTMNNIPDLKWDAAFLKNLGLVPSPYHRYYYMTDRLLGEEQAAAAPGGPGTRAEQVQAVEEALFARYRDETLAEKPPELAKRGGAYYSEAAVSLISAIQNDKNETHTVNTRNNGAIAGLPADAVVEINCRVGKGGAVPLPVGPLPPDALSLAQQVKAYERLAIEAAVTGDRAVALAALAANPLVPSADVAGKLLDEILAANREYLPRFAGQQ